MVREKQHTVQMAYSIVKDADIDECSDHETEALGDSGLFDLMRVSYFKSQFYPVMYCNRTNLSFLLGFCEDANTSN